MTFAPCVEHSIPVKNDGAALVEFMRQLLDGCDKATTCCAESFDKARQSQLHNVLNVEYADRNLAVHYNDRIHFRLFEFRHSVV